MRRHEHVLLVVELGGKVADNGHLCPGLDERAGNEAHMVGRPAGYEVDKVYIREVLLAHGELVQDDALLAQTPREQPLQGLGLLGYLLGHEVGVAAERGRGGVPVYLDDGGGFHGDALLVEDLHVAGRAEARELAVLQLDDAGGDARERSHVRGSEGPLGRRGHHERGPVAGADDLAGGIRADHRKGPGALESAHGMADGGHEVALAGTRPGILDEVGDDLGIRVGDQIVPIAGQIGAQLAEVLDDAVVHDGYAARAVTVRVGVSVCGGSVRGPARVRYARGPHQVGRLAALAQDRDAARALDAVKGAVCPHHLNAGGVVAAVLESREALEKVAHGLVPPGIANDSAHAALLKTGTFELRLSHVL